MFSLSKEQSIRFRRTIHNAYIFVSELSPFHLRLSVLCQEPHSLVLALTCGTFVVTLPVSIERLAGMSSHLQ